MYPLKKKSHGVRSGDLGGEPDASPETIEKIVLAVGHHLVTIHDVVAVCKGAIVSLIGRFGWTSLTEGQVISPTRCISRVMFQFIKNICDILWWTSGAWSAGVMFVEIPTCAMEYEFIKVSFDCHFWWWNSSRVHFSKQSLNLDIATGCNVSSHDESPLWYRELLHDAKVGKTKKASLHIRYYRWIIPPH